ncbi:hypothetical protein ACQ5SK_04885 [Bradyrhizobium japonicum]
MANVLRGGESVGANADLVLQKGDIVALGGATEHLTDKMGLIGPRLPTPRHLALLWIRPISSSPTRRWSGGPLNPSATWQLPASCRSARSSAVACRFRPASRPSCSGWTSSRWSV